jgi:hypothetical protein
VQVLALFYHTPQFFQLALHHKNKRNLTVYLTLSMCTFLGEVHSTKYKKAEGKSKIDQIEKDLCDYAY